MTAAVRLHPNCADAGRIAGVTSESSNTSTYIEVVTQVCERLDSEKDRSFTIHSVHDRLHALSKEKPDDAMLRTLAHACGYHMELVARDNPYACGVFAPMWEIPQENGVSVFPVPLDRVEADVLDLWSALASEDALPPIVRARLADLLWTRRHRGPVPWFRVAVPAYLDLADTNVHIVERSDGLQRAAGICREAKQRDLLDQVLDAVDGLVQESLSRTDDEFGIVIRGLSVLVDNGYDCAELVAVASALYSDSPWQISSLRELSIKIATSDSQREKLQSERVGAFEAAADAADGLPRSALLTTALEFAESAGLTADAQRVRNKLENTDALADARTIEVTQPIDLEGIREEIGALLGTGDLREALLRYGMLVPVDDPEQTLRAIAAERNEYPLQSLFTHIHFGPHGSATVLPSGHEMRDDADVGQRDAMSIGIFASTSGSIAMDEIQRRYDPRADDVAECIQNEIISPQLAERIARSYERWRDDDYTSAVAVLTPAIEEAVRNICRRRGINVTRRRATSIQSSEARTLGPLLDDLQGFLGPARHRYLQAALVDRWSLNLRHTEAHGLNAEPTAEQYVVLFHIACVLMLVATVVANCPMPNLRQSQPTSS